MEPPLTQIDHPDVRDLEMLDDAALLQRSRRSARAFRIIYDRHAGQLFGFLARRTGDPTTAFELTSETFAQAWLSRARFRDPGDGSAAPWLFGIARNLLASSVRRRVLEDRARQRLQLTIEATEGPVDPAWLEGLDDDLSAALAALPAGQRRAVSMRVIDGYPYDELGAALAISPGTARVRVHRGLAAMRRRLATGSSKTGGSR